MLNERFPIDPQTGFKDIDRELAEEQAEWDARDWDAINAEWDEIYALECSNDID